MFSLCKKYIYTHWFNLGTASKIVHKLRFFVHVYWSIFHSRIMKLVPIDPSPQLKFVIFPFTVQSSSFLPSLWWMGLKLGYCAFSSLPSRGSEIGILCVCLLFFSLFSFEVGFRWSPSLLRLYPVASDGLGLTYMMINWEFHAVSSHLKM